MKDDKASPQLRAALGGNLMLLSDPERMPIIDETGYPLAALSLSAPERRMTAEVTEGAIAALRRAAGRIA